MDQQVEIKKLLEGTKQLSGIVEFNAVNSQEDIAMSKELVGQVSYLKK